MLVFKTNHEAVSSINSPAFVKTLENKQSPMTVFTGPAKLTCSQQGYTSGPSAPKAHIDGVSLNGSHADTC